MDALQALADVFYACVGTGVAVRHPPVRRASIHGDDRPPLKGGGILLQPRVTVEHPALVHATRERIGGGALQLVTGLFESGVFEELDNAVRATYAQTFRPLVDEAALWARMQQYVETGCSTEVCGVLTPAHAIASFTDGDGRGLSNHFRSDSSPGRAHDRTARHHHSLAAWGRWRHLGRGALRTQHPLLSV